MTNRTSAEIVEQHFQLEELSGKCPNNFGRFVDAPLKTLHQAQRINDRKFGVALIDTNVDTTVEALKGITLTQDTRSDIQRNGSVHGTMNLGLLAGGVGQVRLGVLQDVKSIEFLGIDVYSQVPDGNDLSTNDVTAAIELVANRGDELSIEIVVVPLQWKGVATRFSGDILDAIRLNKDRAFVFAAGDAADFSNSLLHDVIRKLPKNVFVVGNKKKHSKKHRNVILMPKKKWIVCNTSEEPSRPYLEVEGSSMDASVAAGALALISVLSGESAVNVGKTVAGSTHLAVRQTAEKLRPCKPTKALATSIRADAEPIFDPLSSPIAVTVTEITLNRSNFSSIGDYLTDNPALFGGRSEPYLMTLAVDAHGREQKSIYLSLNEIPNVQIGKTVKMLGDGHLVYGPRNPGDFVAVTIAVLESDFDVRCVGERFEAVSEKILSCASQVGLKKALKDIDSLTGLPSILESVAKMAAKSLRCDGDDLLFCRSGCFLRNKATAFQVNRQFEYSSEFVDVALKVIPLRKANNQGPMPRSIEL